MVEVDQNGACVRLSVPHLAIGGPRFLVALLAGLLCLLASAPATAQATPDSVDVAAVMASAEEGDPDAQYDLGLGIPSALACRKTTRNRRTGSVRPPLKDTRERKSGSP